MLCPSYRLLSRLYHLRVRASEHAHLLTYLEFHFKLVHCENIALYLCRLMEQHIFKVPAPRSVGFLSSKIVVSCKQVVTLEYKANVF